MEETTQHDPAETDPTETDASESDPESAPQSDPPGGDEQGKEHDLEFQPERIEADPAYNPEPGGLKDLKGG
jgi:hypothetical protein